MQNNYRFTAALPSLSIFIMMIFIAVFPRLLLAPLLLRISIDLGIHFDAAALFFLSTSVGFSGGLILSGIIASRITHRSVIITGAVMTGIMLLLLSITRSLLLFHCLLVLLGFSNGLYHGSGIASVARMVPDNYRVRALSFHEMGPNLAFILAPLISALLAPLIGWRGVFAITGVAALGAGLAFALSPAGEKQKGDPPHFSNLKLFASIPAYWILVILTVIVVSLSIGVFAVLPTFLQVEHNLSERFLNTLIGFSRVAGFLAIFAAGYLADRTGYRIVLSSIMLFTGLLTVFLGLLSGLPLLIAVFLQPMVTQSFFPVAIGAITRLARPAARNLAVSLAIPLSNILGGGLTPTLLGAAGAAGYFSLGFIVLGVLALGSSALLLLLPRKISDAG